MMAHLWPIATSKTWETENCMPWKVILQVGLSSWSTEFIQSLLAWHVERQHSRCGKTSSSRSYPKWTDAKHMLQINFNSKLSCHSIVHIRYQIGSIVVMRHDAEHESRFFEQVSLKATFPNCSFNYLSRLCVMVIPCRCSLGLLGSNSIWKYIQRPKAASGYQA